MFPFTKKPKRPLDEVFNLIGAAEELLYTYLRDKGYHPTEEELALFDKAQEAFWQSSTVKPPRIGPVSELEFSGAVQGLAGCGAKRNRPLNPGRLG